MELFDSSNSKKSGWLAQASVFAHAFSDGVTHPFSSHASSDDVSQSKVNKTEVLSAQAGHLAGQLADAAVAMMIARKLPFLKETKALNFAPEISSSHAASETFLHATAPFVPRQTSAAKIFAQPATSAFDNIHMDAEHYTISEDASHLIESTKIRDTTYKMTSNSGVNQYLEKTEPFKFYKLKGLDTEVGMPVDFADSLEKIRKARQQSATLDGFTRDQFNDYHASSLHGYDSAILPEQMTHFLRELPNPNLVKELLLIPQRDLKAGAAVDLDNPGRVQMFEFKRFLDPYVDTVEAPFYLRHEWSHLTERQNDSLFNAFKVARALEKDGYFAHETAIKSASEDWAVHLGENLIDPDAGKFLETVQEAPIRSLVLLQTLKQQLAKGSQAFLDGVEANSAQRGFVRPQSNPFSSQLRARVELGEQMLVPEVRSLLRKQLITPVSPNGILVHRYASLMRQNGLELLSFQ